MKTTSHASLFVCFALSMGSLAWAQSIPPPDTSAGRVLASWLEAFNSGDKARFEQFEAKYDGRDPNNVENVLRFRANTGGFDIGSIRKSTATYIEYMAKERATGRDVVGMLEVTGAEAPRIQNSQLRLVAPGAPIVGFEIDAATRKRVVEGVIEKLNESYVFPETAGKMEVAIRKAQKRGEYKQISNGDQFARLLTTQLQEVSRDRHLRVNFSPVAIPPMPAESAPQPPTEEDRRAMLRDNCGFERVERLAGNVGFVKFNQFADPDVCKETVAAAMAFVANTDAVIFDMRENGGGWPQMVAFITSYLFAERTHLNDFWNRRTGETRQSWTSEDVPGKKLTTQPVFVLTAKRTFSGAEEFSYNLKHLKRATIVGEFTGGGAHPVRGQRIDERFSIGVPDARPINAVTKTNWEGTGVEPDVQVPAADALATAQKLAAERVRAVGAR
jgi:retinol-binding protein 3